MWARISLAPSAQLSPIENGAAIEEPAPLLPIGLAQLIEADGAESRIAHIGRDRGGAIGRADRAGDEALPAVLPRRNGRRFPGEARAGEVQLGDQRLCAVVGLRDAGR